MPSLYRSRQYARNKFAGRFKATDKKTFQCTADATGYTGKTVKIPEYLFEGEKVHNTRLIYRPLKANLCWEG